MKKKHLEVLLFDNCPIFVGGMQIVFETCPSYHISCFDSAELVLEELALRGTESIDLFIVGPHIDPPTGFIACREALKHNIHTIYISNYVDDHIFVADAVYMGVDQCLSVNITATDLLTAVSQTLTSANGQRNDGLMEVQLSEREIEIVRLWFEGKTDKEVAIVLCISHATARNHAARILTKLSVHNRNDTIHRARHHGLI